MSEETPADLQQLVNAIKQNTTWLGQTIRELRDRVEEGAKQMAKLPHCVEASGRGLEEQLARLAAVMEANGRRVDRLRKAVWVLVVLLALTTLMQLARGAPAEPVRAAKLAYNHPGLLADLGVGLWGWPLPMDYNHDGLIDLVVVCAGRPSNGAWFFENTGMIDPQTKLPVFKAGVRLGPAPKDTDSPQVSYASGQPIVTTPGEVYPNFLRTAFAQPEPIPAPPRIYEGRTPVAKPAWPNDIRANEWTLADYWGSGRLDLVVGLDYWGDYGWEDAHGAEKPAYDERGRWKYGPLHGYVYVLRNLGTNRHPVYGRPEKIMAGDRPVDVYGTPSPCFADFRGTGKLDLICGEFLDGFTYFENIGTRSAPRYAPGRRLTAAGRPLTMDYCMITPVACDFLGHGRPDLVVGEDDGKVALLENTGEVVDGVPQFLPPRYFRQVAQDVKFGSTSAPAAADMFGTGRDDLVVGDGAGYIGLIRNLGGNPPRWAEPVYLSAGGRLIRIQAGYNGDIQGPSEAKWGYTNVSVADWDGDGLTDLVMLDSEGYLALYRRRRAGDGRLELLPGQRVFWGEGVSWYGQHGEPLNHESGPLRLNATPNGSSGRRTYCFTDWDGDGIRDLLVNSSPNINFFKGLGRNAAGNWVFKEVGPVDPSQVLARHSTTPTIVHWADPKCGDLLFGAEDGFFYYLPHPSPAAGSLSP